MPREQKQFYNMYGKPSERLILIALCKKFDCKFDAANITSTGMVTVTGSPVLVLEVRAAYDKIISIAYKKLAFAQATPKLSNVQIRTLTSEFMQAFAAMAYSLITGEPFMFKAKTESHRAGLKAGGSI